MNTHVVNDPHDRRSRISRLLPNDPVNAGVIAVSVLLAVGLDALQLSRPGYLFGLTADISVYLGAAVRLVHGSVPYRDFVFLQPPGAFVVLSPFALVSNLVGTRASLAILRLATLLIAGTNVLLIGRLVRHRGRLTTVVACGLMAMYPAERYALNSGLLEPITNLFCLAGASLVFERESLAGPRRILLGGALFGIAGAVKAPAIVPVLVVSVVVASSAPRCLIRFLGGVAAGFGGVAIAFFALAPAAFVHDIVASQLARIPGMTRTSVAIRLQEMTFGGGKIGAFATVTVIILIVIAGFTMRPRRPTALDAFCLTTAATVTAAQFATTQYYAQYPAFLAPFVAMVVGIAVGRLGSRWQPRIVSILALTGLCLLLVSQVDLVAGESTPDVQQLVDTVVPPGACALSNPPELIFTTDRFASSASSCTAMVDPFGTMLAFAHDPAGGVAAYAAALSRVDYIVLDRPIDFWLVGPYATLLAYIGAHFRVVNSGTLFIYVREGSLAPAKDG